jgi:CBS domain-containing protein
MRQSHEHCSLVFKGKQYIGVLDRNWLRTSRVDPTKMKIDNVVKHRSKSKISLYVPELRADTSIIDMCRLFDAADTHLLPVLHNGKVQGVVQVWDVVKSIRDTYKKVPAQRISSRSLYTCGPNDEIGLALKMMNRRHIGRLPVVDDKQLVGFISLIDIIKEVHVRPRKGMHIPRSKSHANTSNRGGDVGEKSDILKLPVKSFMTTSREYVVSPSDPVSKVIDLLCSDCVSSVVLAKNKAPVGIITVRDIVRDAYRRLRSIL